MGNINPVIDLSVTGGIALITADSPPVNALGHAVREGLHQAFAKAMADDAVRAIVLSCKGRTFFAGADITEFGKTPRAPSLHDNIAQIEACPKPVVAAMFGTALGGGLEIALGCHYRVAVASARMGLPEVKLGILPGAGGTQRLPRLVGPEHAVGMIVSGAPISAKLALAGGVIDEIVEEAIAGGMGFAHKILAEGRALRKVRDINEKIEATRANPAKFEEAAAAALKKLKGVEAPAACVQAVRNAFTLPFDEGIAAERDLFMKLVVGDQSRAQRHIFFAEREALKIPDMPASVKPAAIKRAVIIGGGTMGGGIAMCFANVGIPVTIVETAATITHELPADPVAQRVSAILARHYASREAIVKRIDAKDSVGIQWARHFRKHPEFKPTVRLTATLIVKNEAQRLSTCLKSISPIVDEIVIVDTGSTDETIEIAKSFIGKGPEIIIGHFDWIGDFAAARNHALSLATGDWILLIDADEQLTEGSYGEIRQALIRPQFGGYHIRIINFMDDLNDELTYMHSPVRLFRHLPEVTFIGRIHEQVVDSLVKL
ncbi:MAG: hypothetical protein B7Z78_09065, partial [Rhodospirillales bacterium 20-60-12]